MDIEAATRRAFTPNLGHQFLGARLSSLTSNTDSATIPAVGGRQWRTTNCSAKFVYLPTFTHIVCRLSLLVYLAFYHCHLASEVLTLVAGHGRNTQNGTRAQTPYSSGNRITTCFLHTDTYTHKHSHTRTHNTNDDTLTLYLYREKAWS